MTTNSNSNHERDQQLSDEAMQAAADSLPDLLDLIETGIPERVRQIQTALHELIELSWCTGSAAYGCLASDDSSTDERADAARTFGDSEALEAIAGTAIKVLSPWCHSSTSERLSSVAREVHTALGSDGLQHRLYHLYRGKAHWEAVSNLNALLRDGEEGQ